MNNKKTKGNILAVFFIFFFPWIFFFPSWLGPMCRGDNLFALWYDAYFAFDSVRHGIDPLWNPYLMAGYPSGSYSNTGIYSILSLPHLFIPHVLAANFQILLVYSIAGLGVFLYTRKLGISVWGSLFGSIYFELSGIFFLINMQSYFIAGASFIGYCFYCMESIKSSDSTTNKLIWTIILGIILAVQFAAGHQQMFFISCIAYSTWFLYYSIICRNNSSVNLLFYGCASLIIFLFLSAVIWLPEEQLFYNSIRQSISYTDFTNGSVPLLKLASLVLFPIRTPNNEYGLYIGIPVAMLALFGLAGRNRQIFVLHAIICIISIFLVIGKYSPINRIIYNIPIINSFKYPIRNSLIFCFSSSILASIGANDLFEKKYEITFYFKIIYLIIFISSSVIIFSEYEMQLLLNYRLYIVCALLFAIIIYKSMKVGVSTLFKIILLLLFILPIWTSFGEATMQGFDPRPERSNHWSKIEKLTNSCPRHRLLNLASRSHREISVFRNIPFHNMQIYNKWYDVNGYQPMMLARYSNFLGVDIAGNINNLPSLLSYNNRTLDLLNVHAILISSYSLNFPDGELLTYNLDKRYDIPLTQDLEISLQNSNSDFNISLPPRLSEVNKLYYVSFLSYSSKIAQNDVVAKIVLSDHEGQERECNVIVGIDTAEIIYSNKKDAIKPSFVYNGISLFSPIDRLIQRDQEAVFNVSGRTINEIAINSYLINSENIQYGDSVMQITIYGNEQNPFSTIFKAGIDTAPIANKHLYIANVNTEDISSQNPIYKLKDNTFLKVIAINPPIHANTIKIKALNNDPKLGTIIKYISIRDTMDRYVPLDFEGIAHKQTDNIIKQYDLSNFYLSTCNFEPIKPLNLKIQYLSRPDSKTSLTIENIIFSYNDKYFMPIEPFDLAFNDTRRFRLDYWDNIAYTYDNLRSLPRAWLVNEYIILSDDETLQAIRTSKLPDGSDFYPSKTALVEKEFNIPSTEYNSNNLIDNSVKFDEYSNNFIRLTVNCKISSMLILSEIYYPGWKASINGQNTAIYRVDYILRGILLKPGKNEIKMEFRPDTIRYGRIISLTSLIIVFTVIIYLKKYK